MFEKSGPIIAPLILIIVCNEIGDSFPISTVNRMKQMFGMQTDLMLRSPKPEQIQSDAERNG
jgi:SAM-dependent MidA family methyltransferase